MIQHGGFTDLNKNLNAKITLICMMIVFTPLIWVEGLQLPARKKPPGWVAFIVTI